MVFSKRDDPKWELCVGNIKLKQVLKFNGVSNRWWKNVTEIRRCIRTTKDVFKKLSKTLRNSGISLEAKKRALNCCIIYNLYMEVNAGRSL